MESVAGKKELENTNKANNNGDGDITQEIPDSSSTFSSSIVDNTNINNSNNKESERQARDLKVGLHPLKVNSPSPVHQNSQPPFLSLSLYRSIFF